jgi:hypothetical protein
VPCSCSGCHSRVNFQKGKLQANALTFTSDFGDIFSKILWRGLLPRGGVLSLGDSELKLNAFTLLLIGDIVRSGERVIL